MFPLFRPGGGSFVKSCDAIIFHQPKQPEARLFVLLCELKRGHAGESKPQLENTRLLADYIIAMARYHRPTHETPELLFRGLVFSPRYSPPKTRTRDGRVNYIPNPGRMPDLPLLHVRNARYELEQF